MMTQATLELRADAHAFELSDLNTTINHEPRILDLEIAKRLKFKRPRVIRELIERNLEELKLHGSLAVRHGKSRGQEFTEYYLNEGQCLTIAALSKTEVAVHVRYGIITVFMEYRRSLLPSEKPVVVKEHKVRAHRRALPAQQKALTADAIEDAPKPFEQGSNILLDLLMIAESANMWVKEGLAPDFGRALVEVLNARHACNTYPDWEPRGILLEWHGTRARNARIRAAARRQKKGH